MMNHDPKMQLISIGEAVELLRRNFPDISHSSLRFLEQGGLITPQRRPGGHRLYSDADIERVRTIKRWQSEGLSLDAIRERLEHHDRFSGSSSLCETFAERALAGDVRGAFTLLVHEDELGTPMMTIFDDVIGPALCRFGEEFTCGEMPVSLQHELTEMLRDYITRLTLSREQSVPSGPVVIACTLQGEDHSLGLRMLCGLLRERGLDMRFLGADVALTFLLEAIARIAPRLVLLSSTIDDHHQVLTDVDDAVRSAQDGALTWPRVVTGGQCPPREASAASHGTLVISDPTIRFAEAVTLVMHTLEGDARRMAR